MMNDERKGMLLIVSGPSGVGKGTLNQKLLAANKTINSRAIRDFSTTLLKAFVIK